MSEGQEDNLSVLRCGQCNKPFDEQSTLKRHGYYCRSRRAGRTIRSRSCLSCAKGKARCDNKRPECSRCKTKAIECHYPGHRPKATEPKPHSSEHDRHVMAPSLAVDSSSHENRQEPSNASDMTLDHELVISDPEFPDMGGEFLDWSKIDIDFADLLPPQTNEKTVPFRSSVSPALARNWTQSIDRTIQVQQAIALPNVSIPTAPTFTIRSLIQRPRMKTGPQRIANLILHALRSYPLMMLRHDTLPPFIHPYLTSPGVENVQMEPLTNCMSLVHMIGSRAQGSRKLFWKNVRQECERLCAEQLDLSRWELLAAIQALSIYIFLRMDEGETNDNNLDFLLLATVTMMCKQLDRPDIDSDIQSALCNCSLETSWKEWIFDESRRRLSVVYRVLNMVVYFDPAKLCTLQTDLVIAPLPAKKHLWEAGDQFAWKARIERDSGLQTDFGLDTNGDMVKLDGGQSYCHHGILFYKALDARASSGNADNWEEWCSGMDGLGGLVMLAASLLA